MNNSLNDLNRVLFEQLERINTEELSSEELDKEIQRAESITKVERIHDKLVDLKDEIEKENENEF